MFKTLLMGLIGMVGSHQVPPLFTVEEKANIQAFWSQSDRLTEQPATAKWVVRQTPEGSKWLWTYNRARGISKVNPNTSAAPQTAEQAEWETWIDAKIAHDRALAAKEAAQKNGEEFIGLIQDLNEMPEGLRNLAGEAPSFATAVQPIKHTVRFDDVEIFYVDQLEMRPKFAYFRFGQGVKSPGIALKNYDKSTLDEMWTKAGLTPTEARVMGAVSPLEGGFDSVNTYDTGYVSVGFIQFACLEAGRGSLGKVLLNEKTNAPEAFQRDFRNYGIDVAGDASLVVIDPSNGDELVGPQAAKKVVDDKRLTAAFQRAGRLSEEFKFAQIRVARSMYYPANDTIAFRLQGQTVRVKVKDVIKSEAGLAVLMDRKVNTGTLLPLPNVLTSIAEKIDAKVAGDLAAKESEIISALVYRHNFLNDLSLSQPESIAQQRIVKASSPKSKRSAKGLR